MYSKNCPSLVITTKNKSDKFSKIRTPQDASQFFKEVWDGIDLYESFYCLFIDNSGTTIGWYKASQGGLTGTVVDVRLIAKKAIDCLATAVILCHNHPSGNDKPSDTDIATTEKVRSGLQLLDIKTVDHIIITSESYYSFSENDLL